MTSDHSGKANAAEEVSGMHDTEGRKTRKVAAYSAISDRAFNPYPANVEKIVS